MAHDQPDPIQEHLPRGAATGYILVVSDYRPLNLGHAATLCLHGYAVYTAVTCTDVFRIFDKYHPPPMDLVAFASLVHGWHHREGERRPADMCQKTDAEWQTRNMRAVLDLVRERQLTPPRVLIAMELMSFGWYKITAEELAEAGLRYQTYPANDPHVIVDLLRRSGGV